MALVEVANDKSFNVANFRINKQGDIRGA
jgi:hypothetical protein